MGLKLIWGDADLTITSPNPIWATSDLVDKLFHQLMTPPLKRVELKLTTPPVANTFDLEIKLDNNSTWMSRLLIPPGPALNNVYVENLLGEGAIETTVLSQLAALRSTIWRLVKETQLTKLVATGL